MKSIRKIVLLVVLSGTSAAFLFAEIEKDSFLEDRIKPSCVKIICYDKNKREIKTGSGFFVSGSRIITNRHVMEDSFSADIKTVDRKLYPVVGVVAYDLAFDLVLMQVDVPLRKFNSLTVSSIYPMPGEKIIVIGSPLGRWPRSTYGRVAGVYEYKMLGRVIDHTAATMPGNSGSPVVTFSGYVIGVNTWGWKRPGRAKRTGLAIPSEKILALNPRMPKSLEVWNREVKDRKEAFNLFMLGRDLFFEEKYSSALKYLQKAVVKDEAIAEAWAMLGFCKQKDGRLEDAIEDYKTSLHHKVTYPEAYYYLGVAYEYLNKLDLSADALRDAILQREDYKAAHFKLGMVYLQMGKKKDALRQVEKLKRLDSGLATTLSEYIEKQESLK